MPQIWHPRILVHPELYGKPAVLAAATRLGVNVTEVVGGLIRVWLKFQAEATTEGILAGRDAKWVDEVTGRAGFAEAMAAGGWLEVGDRRLKVPSFDDFISKKAVRRYEHAMRVAARREEARADCAGGDGSIVSQQRTTAHNSAHADPVVPPAPVVPPPAEKKQKGRAEYPACPLFDRFWGAYPRKEKKLDARAAFARLGVTEEVLARMLAAVARQAAAEEWRKDRGRFIPHPTTWLNGRRWEDESGSGGGVQSGGRVVAREGKYSAVRVIVAGEEDPARPAGGGQPSLFPEGP